MKAMILVLSLALPAASAAAAKPERVFPANSPIPATVTLLPRTGDVGRDTPFYSHYRPELRAADARTGVTCDVDLGSPEAKVEPGETRAAVLRCLAPLAVARLPGHFDLVEGGRKVGSATVGAD